MATDAAQPLDPVACTRCDRALVRAFEFLGKRWSGVVLGSLISGPAGYRELSRAIDGISDSVLSDRLSALTAAGLVSRTVDEGPPLAVQYALTERGRALIPALEALGRWAEDHLPEDGAA
ncbi:MAG TPA: helix-turn-helix domain-containing protein [Solirubrobacteraceae bacterium]|jgi:DNA-binding HxlR family transcriptional regulator|nr:helix-turn-helix domain-containing protein [Solirubrobacteraceae bacterium]